MKAHVLVEDTPPASQAGSHLETRRGEEMHQPSPQLQIRIYGTDGALSTFSQDDPAVVQRILRESQRADFFAQHRIIVAGQSSLTTFVVSNIARMDLEGEDISARPRTPASQAPQLIEISKPEFLYQVEEHDLKHVERRMREHAPVKAFVGFLDIQLVGGRHVYLKFHGLAALPAERLQKVHSFLMLPSLSFRLSGGGLGIVNLSNVSKFTAYPGPADVPADAWVGNEIQNNE
jgi:hypothetical protein